MRKESAKPRALGAAVALALTLAMAAGISGCAQNDPAPRRAPVPTWTAELPGRTDPIEVTLPAHFDDKLPRAPSEYVLRTEVAVPEDMRGRPLTLAIEHMPALATLHVDGVDAVPFDTGILDRYRASSPHRWHVSEDASRDGRLRLELRVSHRFLRSGWIDSIPELTTHPLGGARIVAVHAFNTVAGIGALAASSVVAALYVLLYLSASRRDKRRTTYGWFALGSTAGMFYPSFVLGLTQPAFGVFEGPVIMSCLVVGSVASIFLSRSYFSEPPPSRAWFVVLGLALFASLLASNPFVSILVMGPFVGAVTVANVMAQFVFSTRLRRAQLQKGPQSGKVLEHPFTIYAISLAWPVCMLLGLPDFLAWLGQGEQLEGLRTACVGIIVVSLYGATALSREHLVSLKRAADLNLELGERVKLLQAKHREVELLNDELRRQIAARSRELAEKLARKDAEELGPPPVLEAGAIVEGRYLIVRELGSGGMGTVYEVQRLADGKHFALKALAGGGDSQARARFAREAHIVANVSHPSVVSIVDVDVAKSGFIFLVMELVLGGTTLHDVRRRHRDVPWSLGVLAQVAEGIDAIHEAGIIHRDLKPGNILISRAEDGRRPDVKITDFGISSLVPDGTRISAMERVAASAQSALDANRELDPFGAASGGLVATRSALRRATPISQRPISQQETRKAPSPGLPGAAAALSIERDSGLVTSARSELLAPTHDGAQPASAKSSLSDRPEKPRTPVRAKRTSSSPLTEPGLIFGTPQYMAQELTTGTKNATRASDVFSLGIIAFEVLTGKRPFPEPPVTAKLAGRKLPEALLFREACPTLPAEIAALLDRAMSHDPRKRPTAKELAGTLREAADELAS